jgi:hypothetical protein
MLYSGAASDMISQAGSSRPNLDVRAEQRRAELHRCINSPAVLLFQRIPARLITKRLWELVVPFRIPRASCDSDAPV